LTRKPKKNKSFKASGFRFSVAISHEIKEQDTKGNPCIWCRLYIISTNMFSVLLLYVQPSPSNLNQLISTTNSDSGLHCDPVFMCHQQMSSCRCIDASGFHWLDDPWVKGSHPYDRCRTTSGILSNL